MTATPRNFASLSSALLARKGHARPAMRPQGLVDLSAESRDEIGFDETGAEASVPKPVVLRQRAALDARVSGEAEVAAPVRARAPRDRAARKPLSAFTLRLDDDRHFRLRLASAVTNQSAQNLMIRALDALLDTLPEVDALARQTTSVADRD
ncbi:hypothetical protein [Sphingomonas hengshuiensis]|uniref:Uncharacterized protein n=1 Tax=Sphingomonas hengshuiensis TaxID=1609977 RepID=A0A7U4J8Q8_9SPHN|nr:hypothetical protein [Sphingomonas hengshuiensis]AJP72332.1 hypothetical protein TS85_11870 [Sphingomonas hengshuiensis]